MKKQKKWYLQEERIPKGISLMLMSALAIIIILSLINIADLRSQLQECQKENCNCPVQCTTISTNTICDLVNEWNVDCCSVSQSRKPDYVAMAQRFCIESGFESVITPIWNKDSAWLKSNCPFSDLAFTCATYDKEQNYCSEISDSGELYNTNPEDMSCLTACLWNKNYPSDCRYDPITEKDCPFEYCQNKCFSPAEPVRECLEWEDGWACSDKYCDLTEQLVSKLLIENPGQTSRVRRR